MLPRVTIHRAADHYATLKRHGRTLLKVDDILKHKIKVVELPNEEIDAVGEEAVPKDQKLLLFPERLENDIEEESPVKFLKIFAQKLEQFRRRALLLIDINPIEWKHAYKHLLTDFLIGLNALKTKLWRLFADYGT